MGQPPSGTVTFLLTDIESSTRLWEERPDEMRTLVAEHDARFRAVIEANGGYVVKGTGDGVHAAFARATDAVAAAEQAQQEIEALPELKVRMGINTGEVQERDGDYFGPAVNRAARLMAAGHGGQVLLTGVTADLVPGLVLRSLGEHRLPDLGAPVAIWQLGTGEFPPLRTLDELPGNLPVQRTSFIGRADEVKELAALVTAERVVTLTGPGGVGKSRLALQVAAEVAPAFGDGTWFVSLASLEEGALVAAGLLEALGVPERRGEPAIETLCDWAERRDALVLIDNCEHLLAEVAVVADRLVESSSTITVLTTSQAPLGVRGEQVWTVAPLWPAPGSHDSVELFVDRAHLARADFSLTPDNEAAVLEICEQLDHVPLAVELAAARVRGMAPADISRRLDQRLRLLSSADRSAPGRHRTLDAAVRWSYDLLDGSQQQVFDRLSVFAGPFTIDAAEAVVAGDGVEEWEVLDAILALVDKSLLLADESRGTTRYRLLETMRQFAGANLATADVEQVYRRRHADHYAEFVLSRRPRLHGAGDREALDEVEPELDNIRVALRHAAADADSSRFEELFTALLVLWLGRGRSLEGAAWCAELGNRAIVDPRSSIVALGFGALIINASDLDRAQEMVAAAEALSHETGLAVPLQAIGVRGLGDLMQGRSDDAVAIAEQVIALAPEEPDAFVRMHSLQVVLATLAMTGHFDRFEEIRQELESAADELGSHFLIASTAGAIAPIAHLVDPEHAEALLRRGYELSRDFGSLQANASHAMFIALNYLRRRDEPAAAAWTRRALQLAVDHAPAFIAQTTNTAIAVTKRQSPEDAAVLLGALRSYRARKAQTGTQLESDAEARYEESLRRALGAEFDGLAARGAAFDVDEMLAFAFRRLSAIAGDTPDPA